MARSSALSRPRPPGTRRPEQLQIREVNTGVYVFAADALRDALPRLSADNAQGELYLPQALDLIRADGGTVAAHTVADDERLVLGVNDRAATGAGARAGAGGDPRAAHGGGGDASSTRPRP